MPLCVEAAVSLAVARLVVLVLALHAREHALGAQLGDVGPGGTEARPRFERETVLEDLQLVLDLRSILFIFLKKRI